MTIDIDRGNPSAPAATLVALLRQRATASPEQVAYMFQDDRSTLQICYGELDRQARSIAGWLQQALDKPGPVLICCPSGLDYIAALFGCFYAGLPAIPSSPPEAGRTHRTLARLQATIRNAEPVIALTTEAVLAASADVFKQTPELQPLRWHTVEQIGAQPEHLWHEPALSGDTLAMLMYTSGSTGTPKGVMVSHGNILHNATAFPGFEARPCRTIVSWLPLYHDLGLFLGVVHPLYRGVPAVLMDPVTFVRRPLSWLETMSRYRATTTGAPNFAYDLCVRKITPEQRAQLDLSAWNMALNGAEPVHPDVLDRFTHTFASCGFRPETFYPSYGMSDATATVSGATSFAPPVRLAADREALKHRTLVPAQGSAARILIGCGQPLADQQLVIVDPDTLERCAANQIGEIWLSGPSVAQGYWNQQETTARTFHAALAGTDDPCFFRTGDLGFMHEGELFLVGRLNDLLIIRGQNFYPEDIEFTVGRSHAALPTGGGAVFAIEVADEERVVVVHEVEQHEAAFDQIMGFVRESVAEEHGIQVHAVALIRKGSLPRTSSGKIARKACRAAFIEQRLDLLLAWSGSAEETTAIAHKGTIEHGHQGPSARAIADWLVSRLATLLKLQPAEIDLDAPFTRHGLDSIQALGLTADLESWLGCRINQTLLWSYPSIAALSEHLAADRQKDAPATQPADVLPQFGQHEPVAIIGMGCRYPGAGNPAAFWRMLCDGVDAIREVPAERWDIERLYHPDRSVPGKMYSRWGGFLDNLDSVDATFMGISPREAAHLDPQQRLLFEVAWEALEDAGQVPDQLSGSRTGVFVGALGFDYLRIIQSSLELIDAYTGTGAAHSILANRLSYMFNLCGPSITVDTACSGSLVAIHLACQSLRSGESELAIAGGVNVNLLPDGNVFFSKAGALSPDGRCKPFAAEANGIVRSDGAGVVVLKLLRQAILDNDPIYAVIRGSAVNQDGRTNGIMAPSAQSQEAVLRAAYRQGRVQPDQIQYIETHGTGTSLGDMIEAQALGAVLAGSRPAEQPCRIGSVKSNIGHTEAAAGIASVIKVALALKHGIIPPSLHCQSPNPLIPFDEMRLQVQQALAPWPSGDGPRIAGVSGFGFGGTNAHVVLEGFAGPAPQPATEVQRPLVLPLSAHTDAALRQLAQDYRALLTTGEDQSIQDLCYTAGVRRAHHSYRLAAVGETRAEIAELLDGFLLNESSGSLSVGKKPVYPHKLVWVFSGQGSHWAGMGRLLLEREPVFAAALRRCDALFQQHAGWSIESALTADEARLSETDVAQPMIFAVQVALAALWQSWGITADTIVGHSLGEVAAAHVAGALSLADAVQVVYHRSRLMKRVAGLGKTAAVELTLEQAQLMLAGREDLLAVAGSNSPTSCILSGDPAELSRVLSSLERRNIFCRLLRDVDIAFHSAQMDPLKAELVEALAQIQPQPTTTPLISTVTGSVIDGTALNAAYWGRNLREPFLFATAVQALLEQGQTTFLELSPHPVLAESIIRSGKHFNQAVTVIASLRRNRDESRSLMEALGSLYTLGAAVAWPQVMGEGRCMPLPQYPWQRERYWLDQLLPERAGGYSFDSLIARLGAKTATALGGTHRADAHPLLHSYLQASINGQHFWESALSTALVPYLRDHQVQGLTVLPGSAYVEMGLVAAAALGDSYRLCEVEFKQALFIPQTETCTIQIAVSPGAGGTSSFQIASARPTEHGRTNWIINATGTLEPTTRKVAPANPNGTLHQIQARCADTITADEHYCTMQRYKLAYGPQFQAISGIWRRDGEALGQLCLPAETAHDSGSYALHPVLLDAAFQIVDATLPRDGSDEIFLPLSIRSFDLYAKPGPRIWCHALLRSAFDRNVDLHEADLVLLDESGQVVAEVQGLQLQRLNAASPQDSIARLEEWLYAIDWQALSAAPGTIAGGSWLIFADDGGVGQQLAEVLRAQGVETLLVYREHGLAQRDEQWGIDPASREDWSTLAQATVGRSPSPYENIVYLWSLDATPSDGLTPDRLQADQSLCFGNIARLVQSVLHVGQAPRLWLITAGSQAIDVEHNPLGIMQAPVWGLGRVLMQEHPELRTTLIDLDPTLPGMSVSTLLEALAQADAEDQIGYRQGQRYVARLTAAATTAAMQPPRWRTDASYLITGGLGGLGLEVARWMAQQGARRLILLGRTPLPPRASWHQYNDDSRAGQLISAVRQLEAMGAAVHVAAVDIGDAAQLAAYLDTYRREGWPAIRGVMHAAGVLHDQLLAHTDDQAIIDVLQPKITGAWLLHHLLGDQPLDFFVLFSSLASALGSVGQSSYAAGNAFMDALAHYRHTLGQPAVSINWGPWAEVGMAARSGVNTRLTEQGIRPLLAAQGTAVLHHLMQSGTPQTTAVAIDWSRWFRANPSARSKPFLANMLLAATPDTAAITETAATWAQELAQAAVETQQTLLEEHLLTLTAKVLRVQQDRLALDQPLYVFGIDSIMSIELRNSIEATTAIQLPVAYLLEGPSITKIAAEVLSQLRSVWVHELLTASEQPEIDDGQALALLQTQVEQENDDRIAQLLDQLEHLSAEEVEVLLKDMSSAA